MTKRVSKLGLVLGLSVGAAVRVSICAAQVAAATPAPAAESDDLSEIIVTARRVEERLQDVPISVQVFNQEQLTNHNVVNAQDLALYTPSLSANPNFGSNSSMFAIRGFVQDAGTPPSVAVYFADVVAARAAGNGVPVGDGAGPGYFFDMQNVQVLKGPQGTLFGRNTTGGAVLFVPQKPTEKFEGYVEGSYGNFDMRRVQAAINVPVNDSVRFRIALDDQRRDGFLNNYTGIGPDQLGDVNYTAVRASLVVDVTANIENYTIASFTRSDTDGDDQKLVACNAAVPLSGMFGCDQLAAEKTFGAKFNTVANDQTHPETLLENSQVINTTTWNATDALTLKNIASYAILRDSIRNPLFGTHFPLTPTIPPLDFSVIQPPPGKWTSDQNTITEELRAQGQALDSRLTYQGGVYAEISNPLSPGGNQSPVFLSCTSAETFQCIDAVGIGASAASGFADPIHVGSINYTVGETRYRDYGVYEQATYTLTDQLKLTEGLRYTWDEQSNTSTRVTYQFLVVPPFVGPPTSACTDVTSEPTCVQTNSEQSRAPTWLIDLDYKPINDVLVYGKYTRGYRAGGVFGNSPLNYRVFQPEKVDTYEAGFKSTFASAVHGTFDVTGFYNDFRNQQLQVGFDAAPGAAVSPTTGIVNSGKSRIYGAEVEASIAPVTGLLLSLDYTYLNTKITSIAPLVSTDPNYVVGAAIPVGSQLVLSPKNKYAISAGYTLPLPSTIGRILVGTTFTHTDRQLANYNYVTPAAIAAFGGNFGTLGNRDLLDLNASWNSILGSPLDLGFFGNNITNEHYFTFVAGLGSPQLGFETASVGTPRMYGMRLRYHFGN